jgi:hypothetical protein
MGFCHRASALALSLSLIVANATTCGGWLPTPEARLACCSGTGACPMHEEHSHQSSPPSATRSHADDCCAASERRHSDQPGLSVVAAISAAALTSVIGLPASGLATELTDRWRRIAPIPARAVPRHVLLSVFLV